MLLTNDILSHDVREALVIDEFIRMLVLKGTFIRIPVGFFPSMCGGPSISQKASEALVSLAVGVGGQLSQACQTVLAVTFLS